MVRMPERAEAAALAGAIAFLASAAATAAAEPTPAPENTSVRAASGRPYTIYVNGLPGTDISDNIQKAIDQARAANGGRIVLPPGDYTVTRTLQLAGSAKRFPKGGPRGIALTGAGSGAGTRLHYRGPPGSVVLDMPAPWGCTVANLSIDADNTPGVIGIHYRGGYDRGVNGGKSNLFDNLIFSRMAVGLWIGDAFGPDLVGGTFRTVRAMYVRIGVLVEGANVTGMAFYNLSVSSWNEAAVKLIGHTARRVRENAEDRVPDPEQPGEPAVIVHAVTGEELFRKDIPEYALKRRTFSGEFRGFGPFLWAGGGAPDVTLYNFNAHSADPTTWAIDTNWGSIRVYTARIEGPGGIMRRSSNMTSGRFADVLVDVCATSPGGVAGNAIEYRGQGPFYLIGGVYEANIALGATVLYSMGVKFYECRDKTGGMVSKDYVIPEGSGMRRTGKDRTFPGRRGTFDLVEIPMPRDIGFRQLPGAVGARIHEMAPIVTRTVTAPAGATSVRVELSGVDAQFDKRYQVFATPSFDAGAAWITDKGRGGFLVNFRNPAPAGASIDVAVQRPPFRRRETK